LDPGGGAARLERLQVVDHLQQVSAFRTLVDDLVEGVLAVTAVDAAEGGAGHGGKNILLGTRDGFRTSPPMGSAEPGVPRASSLAGWSQAGPPPRDPDTPSPRYESEEGLPERPQAGHRDPQVRRRVAGGRHGLSPGGGDRQDPDSTAHRG